MPMFRITNRPTMATREGKGNQYEHLTPQQVAALSRSGIALGYEPLRWGEEFENSMGGDGAIARATQAAVQIMHWDESDRDFIYGNNKKMGGTSWQRRGYVEAKQWRPWKTLPKHDLDYMLSLVWVPEEPMAPLEALARVD
jgi:hypothetical protein